uniref:Uncharacterized protein n=1 Tax=Arundo donax TaxID=35708 RepID=A0A0A8XRV6_ARUDO
MMKRMPLHHFKDDDDRQEYSEKRTTFGVGLNSFWVVIRKKSFWVVDTCHFIQDRKPLFISLFLRYSCQTDGKIPKKVGMPKIISYAFLK